MRQILISISTILALSLGVAIGLIVNNAFNTIPEAFNAKLLTIDSCRSKIEDSANKYKQLSLPEIRDFCFGEIHEQGELNEFTIRNTIHLQQYRSNSILLWLVVIITFSGVILSYIQISIARRISATAPNTMTPNSEPLDSELIFERNRVTVRSSIIGLIILVVSFAFFLVYVAYVYPEVIASKKEEKSNILPIGGLGPPTADLSDSIKHQSGKKS